MSAPRARRLPVSCEPCRVRKIRCTRDAAPCSTCQRRGVADECRYAARPRPPRHDSNAYTIAPISPLSSGASNAASGHGSIELADRVRKLEQLLQAQSHAPCQQPSSEDALDDLRGVLRTTASSHYSLTSVGLDLLLIFRFPLPYSARSDLPRGVRHIPRRSGVNLAGLAGSPVCHPCNRMHSSPGRRPAATRFEPGTKRLPEDVRSLPAIPCHGSKMPRRGQLLLEPQRDYVASPGYPHIWHWSYPWPDVDATRSRPPPRIEHRMPRRSRITWLRYAQVGRTPEMLGRSHDAIHVPRYLARHIGLPHTALRSNAQPPADVNDGDLNAGIPSTSGKATQMTYLLLKFRLYDICSAICDKVLAVAAPQLDTIWSIDALIQQERRSLELRYSHDTRASTLPIHHQAHVNILRLYSNHLTLLLHHKYSMGRGADHAPVQWSRQRCLESARQLLAGYQALNESPDLAPFRWYARGLGSFHAFHAATALLANLPNDGEGHDQDYQVLHATLETFDGMVEMSSICAKAAPALRYFL
ncbi:hypothetical protein M409DRAFT_49053 [Zasmidium cellare ATCC 36951]|uniref:Zn(2)-C6 fungal-type domain-containing protein n=1 Tax=Zasmidium cellare ATCC 36951 TaxID=1080233 RepID=A0A6A6D7A3_ZASCE|nr:uncharacterized protein M409DRAFT_49053 [Zasmidium cellare ATCC 36951]KAF2174190.1 hypothetical protein M409DRAFT_49053 [Zasmidium cellare ATCC 36951]